jgi:cardiolipin synthase
MYETPGDSVLTSDNDIDVFTHGNEKFKALYEDIESAKKSVHMLYFAFNSDHVGTRFIELLTRKAREGVEVRVIYDMAGNINTRFWRLNEITRAGGQVCSFFSMLSIFKVNYRNHRKIVVIDGQVGYTGGINISKSYIGEHKRIKPWRDTHIRVVGSAVNALQERFLQDWMHVSEEQFDFGDPRVIDEYFPSPQKYGGISMQIVSSGPDVEGERIKCGYVKMINDAKFRIFMQSPYFIPDDAFMLALKLAVDSGVDVRIMLPSVPDKPRVYIVTKSYVSELLKLGVKVYLYRGFLHSKMFVADGDVASIGTTNIDIRSFLLDFEINAFVYDTAFAERCERIFYDDMANSDEITLDVIERRGLPTKMAEAVLRIFSPLL